MAAVAPTYLSTLSGNTPILAMGGSFTTISFLVNWVANRAIYIPFFLPTPFTIQRFTAAAGLAVCNYDIGVFDFLGNKLASTGSFASVHTSNVVQYQAPSGGAQKLQSGRYYYGFACDSSASGAIAVGATNSVIQGAMEMTGCLQQDTAFPLPASYTPVEVTSNLYPFVGITQTAS